MNSDLMMAFANAAIALQTGMIDSPAKMQRVRDRLAAEYRAAHKELEEMPPLDLLCETDQGELLKRWPDHRSKR